jgi:RHS repeat-associated protein
VGQLCVTTSGTSASLKYVLSDLQGTTRAVMNNNGSSSAIVGRHDYLPLGEEIWAGIGLRTTTQTYGGTDAIRQKYGLTERDDVTGLDHTPWRKLESFSGRWTSPDPYTRSMTVSDPQSFNRYSYTQNDPVNVVDPAGLDKGDRDVGGDEGKYGTIDTEYVTVSDVDSGEMIPINQDEKTAGLAGPSWGGEMLTGGSGPQGPPQRPPKERPLIINRPKQPPTMTCEEHEWAVFNKKVEEITQAADRHFEERKGPRLLNLIQRILELIPSGEEVDPGDGDRLADLINKQAKITEIEKGPSEQPKNETTLFRRTAKSHERESCSCNDHIWGCCSPNG